MRHIDMVGEPLAVQRQIEVTQEYDAFGRKYVFLADLDYRGGSETPAEREAIDNENRQPSTKAEANLLSSEREDGQHCPVLDFDLPARLVPSTTPGHFHLYIDKPMSLADYTKLLTVLGEVGILEPGYVGAGIRRGATFVRPEWVKKPGEAAPEADPDTACFGPVKTVAFGVQTPTLAEPETDIGKILSEMDVSSKFEDIS